MIAESIDPSKPLTAQNDIIFLYFSYEEGGQKYLKSIDQADLYTPGQT